MSFQTRSFRLFISSTFSDMEEERNALQEEVFPYIKEFCIKQGFSFQPIDLRWGVNEEASLDQRTMEICIEEIKKCKNTKLKPYFLILLGERHGWCPLPYSIKEENFKELLFNITEEKKRILQDWYIFDKNEIPYSYFLRARFDEYIEYENWSHKETEIRNIFLEGIEKSKKSHQELQDLLHSATELEILEGVFKEEDLENHVVCYFRKIEGLPADSSAFPFVDLTINGELDHNSREKIEDLKSKLRNTIPNNIFEFTANWKDNKISLKHIPKFCALVKQSLVQIITNEIDKLTKEDPLTAEINFHNDLSEKFSYAFVGRVEDLSKIHSYIKGKLNIPFFIIGTSGIGKTALLAKLTKYLENIEKDATIIIRFIGETPDTSNLSELLSNMSKQINNEFKLDIDFVESNLDKIKDIFRSAIIKIPSDKTLIIIVDGLNQLHDSDILDLSWIPSNLPSNIKMIISSTSISILESYIKEFPNSWGIHLDSLGIDDGKEMLKSWLKDSKRTLTNSQEEEILKKYALTGSPLYLKFVFEIAKRWKSYTKIEDYELNPELDGLIEEYFDSLPSIAFHSPKFLTTTLKYLASARYGLTRGELLDLLSINESVMEEFKRDFPQSPYTGKIPIVLLERLLFNLNPFLIERSFLGIKLLTFSHSVVYDIINNYYMKGKEETNAYNDLALYFKSQPIFFDYEEKFVPNLRKISEFPFLLEKSQKFSDLYDILTNFSFIESKIMSGLINDLLLDYNRLEKVKKLPKSKKNEIEEFKFLIKEHIHILKKYPILIYQISLNSISSSEPYKRIINQQSSISRINTWFKWKNKIKKKRAPSIVFDKFGGAMGKPTSCAWSKDGNRVVAGTIMGDLKVWNPSTGIELGSFFQGNEGQISAIDNWIHACDWTKDGKIVSVSSTRILVWDPNSKEIIYDLKDISDTILSAKLSPGESKILIFYEHDDAEVINLKTGNLEFRLYNDYEKEGGWSCSYSPDNTKVAVCYFSSKIGIFSSNGENITYLDMGFLPPINGEFSPSGRYFACGSFFGRLKIWDTQTFNEILNIKPANFITSLSWSNDEKRIAISSVDILILDFPSGKILAKLSGHSALGYDCKWSPDDEYLLTVSMDGSARVWDLKIPMSETIGQENIFEPSVTCSFSPNGTQFFEITPSSEAKIIDFKKMKTIMRWQTVSFVDMDFSVFKSEDLSKIDILAASIFSPDGFNIATGSLQGRLIIWNVRLGKELLNITLHNGNIRDLAYSPNGILLCSCSVDGSLKIINLLNKTLVLNISYGNSDANIEEELLKFDSLALYCDFSPNGRYLAVGLEDGSVSIIDLKEQEILADYRTENREKWRIKSIPISEYRINTITWSPDGRKVALGDELGIVEIWDITLGKQILECKAHSECVVFLKWFPSGNYLASSYSDGVFIIWNTHNGEKIGIFPAITLIPRFLIRQRGKNIYLFDQTGTFYDLELSGIPLETPILIPTFIYNYTENLMDTNPSVRCPFCLQLIHFDMENLENLENMENNEPSYQEIKCPHCNMISKLNLSDYNDIYFDFAQSIHIAAEQHEKNNNIFKAEEYLKLALYAFEWLFRIKESPLLLENISKTKNSLGSLYANSNNIEIAKSCFIESLAIRRNLFNEDPERNKPDLALVLRNLGLTYERLNEPNECEKVYLKSLKLTEELVQVHPSMYKPELAKIWGVLGVLYSKWNKFTEAKNFTLKVLEMNMNLAEKEPDSYLKVLLENYIQMSYISIQMRQYKEAISYTEKALEIDPNNGTTCYNKACVESLLGNKDVSLNYLKKAVDIDDEYKKMAKIDEDFENIRKLKEFKNIVE